MIYDTKNLTYISPFRQTKKSRTEFSKFREGKGKYDNQSVFIALYNSHISYIVHGDLYLDFINTRAFYRLQNIKQLGVLTYTPDFIQTHVRSWHSLSTGIMAEIVERRNHADENDIVLSIVSALLHDIAIPPLSDQGKLACKEELNEEDNIELLLGDFSSQLEKYGIRSSDVIACVRGEYPVIGKLLNSRGIDLDKISYTGIDSRQIFGHHKKIIETDRLLFDIYQEIKILDNDIVFTNPDRVKRFLKVRALLFRDAYCSSDHRRREAFFKKILKDMWDKGVLDKKLLLSLDDGELETIMKKYEPGLSNELFSLSPSFVEVERFYDRSLEDVKRQFGDGYCVERWGPINPATDTLVSMPNGTKNFRDAFPEETKEIEDMMKSCEYIGVYKLDKK